MMNVFIDGSAGTTGLRIADRLASHTDIHLIKLPESLRKDLNARKEAINSADIVFLCLPDAAAVEAQVLEDAELSMHTAVERGRSESENAKIERVSEYVNSQIKCLFTSPLVPA